MAIKLDVGCGPNKKEGYLGIDSINFPNIDFVRDLRTEKLPCGNNTVEEIHASHFVEHLTAVERIHLMNESYRVLEPGGKFILICPYWSSGRAYGDPTHQWPPISDFWFYYLDRSWRKTCARHTDKEYWDKGYDCDFQTTWTFFLHDHILNKEADYQNFAIAFYKEAVQDICATLIKR